MLSFNVPDSLDLVKKDEAWGERPLLYPKGLKKFSAPPCPCCCCLVVMSNSFANAWTVALQPPLSMGFLRQKYWSGLPFPSPRDLPDPGIEPRLLALQADFLPSEPLK